MSKISRKTKLKPGATRLGALPEWDLSALYSGLDDPAIKRDLERTDADCLAFEEAYKGKLAALAAAPQGGSALGEAVRRYEAISDRMGRLGSYAVLIHEGNTVDPARTKFYGDMQRWPIPRSAITGRGSKTCAAIGRTSSRIASSSCFTKNR